MRPSAQPSSQPSSCPSRQPTAQPTSVPTISWETQWATKLTNLIGATTDAAVDDENTEQKIFSNVYGGGDGAFNDQGTSVTSSCESWRQFVENFKKMQLEYRMLSMGLYNVPTLQTNVPSTGLADSSSLGQVCRNINDVDHIADYLTGATSSDPTCDSTQLWSSPDLQCSTTTTTAPLGISVSAGTSTITLQPCKSCDSLENNDMKKDGLNVLSIKMELLIIAPRIDVISGDISFTRKSITLPVYLHSPGTVRCAAFEKNFVPTSPEVVYTAGYVGTMYTTSGSGQRTEVTIPNLLPATIYETYCVSSTYRGGFMTMRRLLDTHNTVITQCCKEVLVKMSSAVFGVSSSISTESAPYPNALVIEIPSPPSSDLTIMYNISCLQSSTSLYTAPHPTYPTDSSSVFYPSHHRVSAGKSVKNLLVNFVGSVPVQCQLAFMLHSTSSVTLSEFSIVYPQGNVFSVLGPNEYQPRPVLSSVAFADKGDSIVATFSTATNRGALPYTFTCSDLFDFSTSTGGNATKLTGNSVPQNCLWLDDIAVSINSNVLNVGDIVEVRPTSYVISSCNQISSSSSTCAPPGPFVSSSTAIQTAPNPIFPDVVITLPKYIGPSSSLMIDLTSSSGQGGRDWLSLTFKVFSTYEYDTEIPYDTAQIQSFLDNNYTSAFSPVLIPSSLLESGASYTFSVTLCNFLNVCGRGEGYTTVLIQEVPDLMILGSKSRTIRRSNQLTINSKATATSSQGTLEYYWNVRKANDSSVNIPSTSKDPSKFIVAANSLEGGSIYTVELSVVDSLTQLSSIDTVYIHVLEGSVVANIKGGIEQSIPISKGIVLDASGSYDTDTGTSSGLHYQWELVQLAPVFQTHCPVDLDVVSSSLDQPTLKILSSQSYSTNTICRASVIVSDAHRQASAETTLSFTLESTFLSIMTNADNDGYGDEGITVVNPGRKLKLFGTITSDASTTPRNVLWSIDTNSGVNLQSMANMRVSGTVPSGSAESFNLVIPPSSLAERAAYTFTLSSGSAYTSIRILMNGAPTSGKFEVTPPTGDALSTNFQFIAKNWQDEDIPLQYVFGYKSSSRSADILIRGLSENALHTTTLPPGSLPCLVRVFDVYGANTTAIETVVVNTPSSVSSLLQTLDNQPALTNQNTDAYIQSVALTLSIVNLVSCNNAPNCGALNRQPCQRTMDTCGPCLDTYMSGTMGDSNDKCFRAPSSVSIPSGDATSCSTDNDCESWQFCDSTSSVQQCVDVQKSCPTDCSSHGSCRYRDINTGVNRADCSIVDSNCVAYCNCDGGYAGTSCADTREDYDLKVSLRTNAINYIVDLTSIEEPTSSVVGNWVESIAEATSSPSELSQDILSSVLDVIDTTIDSSLSSSLSKEDIAPLLSAIDAVVNKVADIETSSMRRRQLQEVTSDQLRNYLEYESAASYYNTYSSIRSSLLAYGDTVLDDTVQGEDFSSLALNEYGSYFALVAPTISSLSIVTPLVSDLEHSNNITNITIDFVDNPTNKQISAFFMKPSLFGLPDILSNAITLHITEDSNMGGSDVSNSSDVKISFPMLRNFSHFDSSLVRSAEQVRSRCFANQFTSHTYHCMNGFNLTVHCNGTAGVVSYYCPVAYEQVACGRMEPNGYFSQCQSLTSVDSPYGITCLCSLSTWRDVGSRRKLQMETTISSDFISYKQTAFHPFSSSFLPLKVYEEENVTILSKSSIAVSFIVISTLLALLFSTKFEKMNNKIKSTTPSIDWKAKPVFHSIGHTMKRYHAYLSIVAGNNESTKNVNAYKNTPTLNKILMTSFLLMFGLFIQSLQYYTVRTDISSCSYLYDKDQCVTYKSPVSFEDHTCQWDPVNLLCEPMEYPNGVPIVTLFYVVIITSFFSQIAYVMIHHFCQEVFTNPAISSVATAIPMDKTPSGITPKASQTRDPSPAKLRQMDRKFRVSDIFNIITPKSSKVVMQFEDDFPYEVPLEQEFSELITMICEHREKLGGAGREMFDDNWGFHQLYFHDEASLKMLVENAQNASSQSMNPTEVDNRNALEVCFSTRVSMLTRLYWKLIKIRQQSYKEIEYCDHCLTPFNRAYRIMHLLQKELMQSHARRILDSYEERLNTKPMSSYSRLFKGVSMFVLVSAYVGMFLYVLWFGSQETDRIQIALCQSFLFWLFLEVFIYETLSTAFTHLTLPFLITNELKRTKDYVMNLIATADYTEPDDMDEKARMEHEESFDLRRYLSVCYRLADHSDDMHFERCVIRTHTMKPEDLRSRDHVSFFMTHPLLFLLDMLMHLPLPVQDLCIRMVNSGLLGGILISLVFWGTSTHIDGAFTNFIIYGAWALVGLSGIYALTTWYRARQSRVQILQIDDDIASTNEGIKATTYQSDQFVLQKNSFLLREEFRIVQSFADVAVGLNPGEFDGPDVVYDFSNIDQAELAAALGRQQSVKSMATEFALDSTDGGNLQSDFDMEDDKFEGHEDVVEEVKEFSTDKDTLSKEEMIALSDSLLNKGGFKPLTIDTQLGDVDDEEEDDFGSDDAVEEEEYDFDQLSAEEILNALNNQSADMPPPMDLDDLEDESSSTKASHWGKLSSHISHTSAVVSEHTRGLQEDYVDDLSTPHHTQNQLSVDTSDMDLYLNAPPISDGKLSSKAGLHDFNDVEYDFSHMSMTDLMVAIGPGEDGSVGNNGGVEESEDVDELTRTTSHQVIITNESTSRIPSRASLGQRSDYGESLMTSDAHDQEEQDDSIDPEDDNVVSESFVDPEDQGEDDKMDFIDPEDHIDGSEGAANISSSIVDDDSGGGQLTLEDLEESMDIVSATQNAAFSDDNDDNSTTVIMNPIDIQPGRSSDKGSDDGGEDDIRGAELTLTQTHSTPTKASIPSSQISSSSKAKNNSGTFTKPRGSGLFASSARVVGKLRVASKEAKTRSSGKSPSSRRNNGGGNGSG